MDESGTYGQFGQAVYDNEDHHWQFQRSTTIPRVLNPLGEPNVIVESDSPVHHRIFPVDGKRGPTRRREKQVKALVRRNPDLQPGSNLLTDLARNSEAVEESAARHDPAKGNLLAFGTARDELSNQRIEIVAFPIGPTGSDLRIVQVRKQRRGWQDLKNAYLHVPTIHGEQATWVGPGVPIQSITVAKPLEGAESFLAVQLITETIIFRPVLRKKMVWDESRLDVNFLVRVRSDQTGLEPHADVAFNPWYPRDFAILDQAGSCTVWDLNIKQPVQIKRVASTPNSAKMSKGALDDCWGRLIWVSSPSLLVLSRRRSLKMFEIVEEHLIERHELDVGLNDTGWILDMVQVPSQLNYILIATSEHLIVCYFHNAGLSTVAQVRHFRNAEDISLRMDCFVDGEDTLLLMRSDLDPTVLVYRLNLAGKGATSVVDPTELVLPAKPSLRSTEHYGLHVSSVDVKGDFHEAVNDNTHRLRFFQLTALHKNYYVRQTLYTVSASAELQSKLGSPTWGRALTKSVHKVLDDDFIINDENADEIHDDTTRSEPVPKFLMRMRKPRARDDPKWTVNNELTERRLNNVDVSDVMGMDEALEVARDALDKANMDAHVPLRNVRELVEGEITMQDLESAASELERLLSDRDGSHRTTKAEDEENMSQRDTRTALQSIASLPILKIRSTDHGHLSDTFNSIADYWISQIPSNAAEIVQRSKEQLARRMAAEVSLASVMVRPPLADPELPLHIQSPSQSQSESQSQSQDHGQVWELPVRPGAPSSSRTTPSIYFDAAASPTSPRLPTPSETGSSSSAPPSNPVLTRLSKYTSISSKTPSPLSKRITRVLSHWPVGADPADYDWASSSRHITRQDEDEVDVEEMTEKERQRLQRRTERYVRRKTREVQETARLQLLSSQAPEIVVGSQPARMLRANSQQATLGAESQSQSQGRLVASQVLPGPHGGRKPVKKKRKSGF